MGKAGEKGRGRTTPSRDVFNRRPRDLLPSPPSSIPFSYILYSEGGFLSSQHFVPYPPAATKLPRVSQRKSTTSHLSLSLPTYTRYECSLPSGFRMYKLFLIRINRRSYTYRSEFQQLSNASFVKGVFLFFFFFFRSHSVINPTFGGTRGWMDNVRVFPLRLRSSGV